MKLRETIAGVLMGAALVCGAWNVNPKDARNQYKPYPVDSIRPLTPAPKGYVPFHIEHYGRHGSRWLITRDNYNIPANTLEAAERNNVLTPLGKEVLDVIKQVRADSKGRLGELTSLGAEQHRGIARRMAANFPEVFMPGAAVDAKSTVVIRCILSMLNEIEVLTALQPALKVTTDASEADMWFMNQNDPVKNAAIDSAKSTVFVDFKNNHPIGTDFIGRLIDDPKFIADSVDIPRFTDELIEVGLNMGSHDGRYPEVLPLVFTPEEITRAWVRNNASWFLNCANSALTDNRAPLGQRNLMRNMIASADTTLTAKVPSANLRFGHEGMILSLACLMQLADYGREINDLEALAPDWSAYKVFPMASNIQLVFYRPEKGGNPDDVMVKILLNEVEMPTSLAKPVQGPYYRWSDLRKAMLDITEEK